MASKKMEEFLKNGFITDSPPICAAGKNSANPHYAGGEEVIRQGVPILIDLWCKNKEPGSIFGEMSCLLDMPYTAQVKALSELSNQTVKNKCYLLAADIGSTLNKVSDLDVTSFGKATEALKTVDSALAFISGARAKLGALQSRFETSIANLQVTSENLSASRSRIMDADFAQETANLSRAQILQQAGTAMVAQANQIPQGVLALLQQR